MPNEISDMHAIDEARYSESNVTQYQRLNQRYSVREIAETIPELDPSNDMPLTAEQFVNRVNTARASYGWGKNPSDGKLKGAARL